MDDSQKDQLLFMQLVMMFHALAMQQMGKTINPVTQKIERDLDAAQSSIDMIDMLQRKTKGNLASVEERFLGDLVKELKLNFVDEAGKPERPTQGEEQKST